MILVFKTSLGNESEVEKIAPALDDFLGKSGSWNVDLEDCDNILRVVTDRFEVKEIELVLSSKGHFCKELDD
ncbi:hypothetical protein DN752_22390 [Echinicola strongylocentroti]|uniref:Uncharacterized protein n=1 Tax=Echinicola strongylocentroti TaxID=1795355 RepID=A0A2Z4IPI5_9BACT|nr:hypothetical protein [Echinicola strongylocentroti]AWW32670.1 hypothetical protein DN752_22390 [Echinicola strongylocentroti]